MDVCIRHMDIAYYAKDAIVLSPEKIHDHFFIIIKGVVHEYNEDDELIMDYQQEDSFDANSLIYSECKSTFKVHEDLICYELEKATFKLIEENAKFKDFFLNNLVNKFQTLKDKEYTSDLSSFMIAKVA